MPCSKGSARKPQAGWREKGAVIMFTRVPVDDAGKSRMAPALSPEQRKALQWACIQDELETIGQLGLPLFVFCTPPEGMAAMRQVAGEACTLLPQESGGLGTRMERALAQVFGQGYSPCVLVGSDLPEITPAHFEEAFALLEDHDVALTPTPDGGYCLIGMKQLAKAAFPDVRYGTASVLEQVMESLAESGCKVATSTPCHDIDTPGELRRLAQSPQGPCRRTLAFARSIFKR